jgi:hypothetical protein
MLRAARQYLDERLFQQSLLNYDVLNLDDRGFTGSCELTFHYAYRQGATLSSEVLRSPFDSYSLHDHSRVLFLAIAAFHQFLETQAESALDAFLDQSRLVLAVTRHTHGYCAVPRYERVKAYPSHPMPWMSCHSQGWALSVFCRAYQVTGENEFLKAALGVLRSFLVEVSEGGIRDRERSGRVFFEEYPFPGRTRHVLNGFVTALLGIHECGRATNAALADDLFAEGIATLTDDVLDTFDVGFTTTYDQLTRRPGPPSIYYTKVHARQMAVLYRLTGQSHFGRRAHRWHQYSTSLLSRGLLLRELLAYRARNAPRYVQEVCRALGID